MKRELKFRVWDGEKIITESDLGYLFPNCELLQRYPSTIMQYIGIKDVNGKEIFEGDIITENLFWDIAEKEPVYFEVIFAYAGFKLEDRNGRIYDIGKCPEIVGNIYENQELLK